MSDHIFVIELHASVILIHVPCILYYFFYNQQMHDYYNKSIYHIVTLYTIYLNRHCCDTYFCDINCAFVGYNNNKN